MKVPSTPSEYPVYNIPRFTGVNFTAEHSEMEDTECALLQNYFQENKFVWKQRAGMTKWNSSPISTTAERVLAMREYIPVSGTKRLLTVVKEGSVDKVYQADYSTKTFSPVPSDNPLTHNEEWSIVQWNDKIFISNGIEPIQEMRATISGDAINWSSVSLGTPQSILAVAYSGGTYVATGTGGAIFSSSDLITWTARTSGTTQHIRSVLWDGAKFVAGTETGVILTSPDGITWTTGATVTAAAIYKIIWTGAQYVAGVNANPGIYTSPDLITWTARVTGQSAIGLVWTGAQYVIVGNGGLIRTSPDAITWTARTSGTTRLLYDVVWSGTQFAAVGDSGVILTSPDGITWTLRVSGTIQPLYGISWSGGQFVITGDTGTILSSSDAITWTSRTSGVTTFIFRNIWTGTQFIAGVTGGKVLYSTAGFALSNIAIGGGGQDRRGRYLVIWKDRLVVAGNQTDPSAVYFSNTLTPTVFDIANVIYAGKDDGDTITALATTGVNTNLGAPTGELIIFKSRSMWVFTGNIYGYASNPSLDVISSVIGCVGGKAFAHTPIGLIWAGADGIYTSLNAGYPERIDAKTRNLFLNDPGLFTTPIDLSVGNRMALGYSINLSHIKMSYRPQGASSNTDQVWCDLRDVREAGLQWCGVMKGQSISCFYNDSNRAQLGGSDNSGYIYTLDSGFTDDGAAVVTKLVTKNFDLSLGGFEKDWRKFKWKLDIYGQTLLTSEFFLTYTSSYATTATQGLTGAIWDSGVWDTAKWASGNAIVYFPGRLPVMIGANGYFVLTGSANTTSQHEVINLMVQYQEKRKYIW